MSLQRRYHRRHAVRVRHRLCVRSAALRDSKQHTTAIILHTHLTWMRLQCCYHRRQTRPASTTAICLCARNA